MLKLAVDFYKNLFGHEEKLDIHLDYSFWEEEDLITDEENDLLVAPFSEEEIKEVIFGSYADGAPRPDDFPFLFYQKFWNVIKSDFMNLVRKFEIGELDITRLNYVMLTLLPKEPDATDLKKFRPITLINCSFKIFSKALNNRLIKISERLISPNQTAFIKGRYIIESVVAAHEIIHEVARKKEARIFLKLDYEKAYDRVNWSFLEEVLRTRGFNHKWIGWILKLVKGGSVCVRLNNENSSYFSPGKGLR